MRCFLLLVVLALAGCGGEEATTPPASPPEPDVGPSSSLTPAARQHWHAEIPTPPPEPGSQKEYVRLDVPEAFSARTLDAKARLVLNLLADGTVLFRGLSLPLATATPEEREAALEALREDMVRVVGGTYGRLADGTSQAPLILHADRRVSWSTVAALLPVLLDDELRFPAIYFAAFRPPDGWERVFGGTWSPLSPERTAHPDALPIRIGLQETERGDTLTIAVGPNRWTLDDHPADFGDAAFVAAMNRTWQALADWLETQTRDGEVVANVLIPSRGSRLWLAHVVKMLDLLKTAGIRDVAFVTEGVGLAL